MQMIFQDPVASLNPSRRVRDIVREGLEIWRVEPGPEADAHIDSVLGAVGLDGDGIGDRRPHEFSGGQCQRICIARALVLEPDVLILPVDTVPGLTRETAGNLLRHGCGSFQKVLCKQRCRGTQQHNDGSRQG